MNSDFRKMTPAAARVNAGLLQREASALLDINIKTLCKWERGESYPNAKQIEKMCEIYDLPIDQLDFTNLGKKTG